MNPVIIFCIMVLYVIHVSSDICTPFYMAVTTATPAIQKKSIGESCTFRWTVTGNFTTYNIKMLSTESPTELGSNTNHMFNSSKGVITLSIWNIQTSNAGHYSLSISTGSSTEVNSVATLFVYAMPSSNTILVVGRNPGFEGDKIELNCSATSNSLPAAYRTKVYYFWYHSWYSYLQNISSGPAMLQNGDTLQGYSIKNDGKTLVIASAQYIDNLFSCSVQEEGSPYKSTYHKYLEIPIYGKPYTYSFSPGSRKFHAAPISDVNLSFSYRANPPLISYTNWSFVNASGSKSEVSGLSRVTSTEFSLSTWLPSATTYGNYSITLTNSNGSITETFQVLPPGPPDSPSNFSVQYVTHSLVSLQWRCMWFNGYQQTVFVRLMDVANNVEVDTQNITLQKYCYTCRNNTLFQSKIQPETDYEASIWSVNKLGSSIVVKLAVKTTKRLLFSISVASILIVESQATISFSIADSAKAMMLLNVTCCVELTIQCSHKTYFITNTDNQIVYEALPIGNEYVFDFTVYDSDGFSYTSTLAIVKGVQVSRKEDPTIYNPCDRNSEKGNPLLVAVIVLAVLLGIAVLAFIGCFIGFLAFKCRQKSAQEYSGAQSRSEKTSPIEQEDNYEQMNMDSLDNGNYEPTNVDPPNNGIYYTQLDGTLDRPETYLK